MVVYDVYTEVGVAYTPPPRIAYYRRSERA